MVLLIGYGNILRADDGIGYWIADALSERANVEILACHQLTPELAEPISRAEWVIFVDACQGEQPGRASYDWEIAAGDSGAFTHNASPAGLLRDARALYSGSPKAVVVTIDAACFDYTDALSPAMQAALPGLVNDIERLIEMLLKGITPCTNSESSNR
jgi:hydrogenase maturation protease